MTGKQVSSLDTAFSRELLRGIIADVRQHYPGIHVMKAWVHQAGAGHWEFHYDGFYWHGSASNAYDARAKGWSAWVVRKEREKTEGCVR